MLKQSGVFLAALILAAGVLLATAQVAGYEWMPPAGRQLLPVVLEHCGTCDALPEISRMELTAEGWRGYFLGQTSTRDGLSEEQQALGALAGLAEREIETLLAYLAINLPAAAAEVRELPEDGQLLALYNCTSCHAIAATMTQQGWTAERWLHLLNDGTHGALGFREADNLELAHYLELNPVPLEVIPPEQREPMPGF